MKTPKQTVEAKYPNYKSSCCGVGVSVGGIGETHYYICNKCDKACDFVPSPNEAPKGEAENKKAFEAIKKTAKRINLTEKEAFKVIEDIRKDLPMNNPQPPSDKGWEELYTTVAIFLDNLNIRDDFPIIVTHKTYKVNDLDSLMKIFLDWLKKHDKALLLSKDQEADRRIEKMVDILAWSVTVNEGEEQPEDKYHRFRKYEITKEKLLNILKLDEEKLSPSHKEEKGGEK